ncbi:uncharacterized protein FOMMEDRAFT_22039 [Fomitiporia mediterranea MF3/22]|uniref:uncharacterized protein n=1 Tax=Fomitiporia mediterranea (strain MF3/22) TaxID=694068 RepID=UPI0004409079|nr:uncharacterized protein FOMMEDRAFT_22039 [Fomitiporia mediterranea MF3/22]EJD01671.1 hypothetical protein FOMMEDRAFT_22039 [Fomitiporia mediterranea MF3/22]
MVFDKLFGRSKGNSEPNTSALGSALQQTQLRTPSPTASISVGTAPPQSPEVGLAGEARGVKRSRTSSLDQKTTGQIVTDILTREQVAPPTSPAELLARVKKVPPKTLHSYVVAHLPHTPLEVSEALMTFFATLVPPPRVHCVRCHKDYTEVENTDRSCLVPHDDESAEVEYVGNSKSKIAGVVGSTYETLWGCCNKVVEGDGDQGPPDGWCFEGYHTTDIKRARFRADSTIHDDKLVSCKRMRCFITGESAAGSERGRSQRAAARKNLREASDEEEDYDERELVREAKALAEGSETDETGSVRAKKKASKGRKRKSEAMEVDAAGDGGSEGRGGVLASPSTSKPRPKSKAESMKPKSVAKLDLGVSDSGLPAGSPPIATEGGDVDMAVPESESKPKPKKPRKPRKSTGAGADGKYVPPKGEVESSDFDEDDDKPKRKKAKRKSTASTAAQPT